MSRSIVATMATKYDMEPAAFEATVMKTVMPSGEVMDKPDFAAFLLIAKEYALNPVTRQIYAFPKKGGGIQPIVSIDGWMRIINDHPNFDGMEFTDNLDNGKIVSITCKMHRKDRSHPTEVTEYMSECRRNTQMWNQWPARMLRHKAAIQAARYAFGFSGIVDPDEAERIEASEINNQEIVEVESEPVTEMFPQDRFDKGIKRWAAKVASGERSKEDLIATLTSAGELTDEMKQRINEIEVAEIVEGELVEEAA